MITKVWQDKLDFQERIIDSFLESKKQKLTN